MKTQLVSDLCRIHSIGQVLFVGKDKKDRLPQLILRQHPHQLVPSLANTLPENKFMKKDSVGNMVGNKRIIIYYLTPPVIAVNHKDESLSVLEVMSPQRTDFVLTTHIPDCETDVLVFHSLNVKP